VALRVRVPAQAVPGKELEYRLIVENCSRAEAHHVVVRDPLPPTVRFVRARPEPTSANPELIWQLGTLGPCARKEIVLVVVPGGDDIRNCARVQFEHGQCVLTRIGRPALRLRKTGPAQALLYDSLTFRLEVSNTGAADATDVVLTDTLPEGLVFLTSKPSTSGTNPLTWKLGTLGPGQSRQVEYQVSAMKAGSFDNRAVAEAGGGLRQEAARTVRVGEVKLAVSKAGPQRRLVNRPATYHLSVHNPGTMPATNVRVADEIPPGITFASASDGGREADGQVQWSLGTLPPGARRRLQVTVRAPRPGTFRNVATVTADHDVTVRARAETVFEAADGLTVEVDKSTDPVPVGREATWTVRLLNAGKAAATTVRVVITVPEGMKGVAPRGPTAPTQDKQTITFAPLAALAPGAEAVWTVTAQAERAGVVRLGVEVTSDQSGPAGPVRAEEPLTIVAEPIPGP
jgi:uncharacterized repeat protein (TIGR01451 family)